MPHWVKRWVWDMAHRLDFQEERQATIIGPGILCLANVYEQRNAGGCGRKRREHGKWTESVMIA